VVLDSFSPLPPAVLAKFIEVEVSSFLGLLPEINRCFITFDNVLLLWNYDNPGDYTWYRGLDQPIRTVALVMPVPGVFEDMVKVCCCCRRHRCCCRRR
jgi:nuclear pore complex protein Nup155